MLGLLYIAAAAALSAEFLPGEPPVMFQIFQIACLLYSLAMCWWLAHTVETESGGFLHPFPDPSLRDTALLSVPSEHLHKVFLALRKELRRTRFL